MGSPKAMTGLLQRVDGLQQRRRGLGFPFAVMKKFGEDQAGNLAALIAYYAFFSVFPLLLAMSTMASSPKVMKPAGM